MNDFKKIVYLIFFFVGIWFLERNVEVKEANFPKKDQITEYYTTNNHSQEELVFLFKNTFSLSNYSTISFESFSFVLRNIVLHHKYIRTLDHKSQVPSSFYPTSLNNRFSLPHPKHYSKDFFIYTLRQLLI